MRSLLPAHESARLVALHIALREEAARLFALVNTLEILRDPLTCPASWLPVLKNEYRPPLWEDGLTVPQKRQLLATARLIRRQAGTVAPVVAAIDAVGLAAHLEEWPEFAGVPGTFRVVIDTIGSEYGDGDLARLERLVLATKRGSTHLIDLQVQASVERARLCIGGMVQIYEELEMVA